MSKTYSGISNDDGSVNWAKYAAEYVTDELMAYRMTVGRPYVVADRVAKLMCDHGVNVEALIEAGALKVGLVEEGTNE